MNNYKMLNIAKALSRLRTTFNGIKFSSTSFQEIDLLANTLDTILRNTILLEYENN